MTTVKWKQEVHERDCHKCKICGSTYRLTVHHKLPVTRGGQGNLENCVCWCQICHRVFHKRWGLTTSDDYGNPVGEFHLHGSKKRSKKARRHGKIRRRNRR